MPDTFLHFAYGPHMDAAKLMEEIVALAPNDETLRVISSEVAFIKGVSLGTTAVSVESPRLGLINIIPLPLPQSEQENGAVSSPMTANDPLTVALLCPKDDRVFGVLYELPTAARQPLLEVAGASGSYNLYGRLPCTVASPQKPREEMALVVAGFDIGLMQQRYAMTDLTDTWQPLPPRPALGGDCAGTVSAAPRGADGSASGTWGTGRWPGTHWCNWPCSARLAPSTAHLGAVRGAFMSGVAARATVPADYMDAHAALYTACLSEDAGASVGGVWYLAYGSNLSWEQVCVRTGPPMQRRPMRLDGYVLVANKTPVDPRYASFGYYNVEPVEARRTRLRAMRERDVPAGGGSDDMVDSAAAMPPYVCGAAYELSQAQLDLMDTFESGYRRECHQCTDLADGTTRNCWVYIALNTSETLLPSKEYLTRVLEGRDILPAEYMDAIQRTPTNPLRSPRQDKRLRKEL